MSRVVVVNLSAPRLGMCRIEQHGLETVPALLPDGEVVTIGVNIEDFAAHAFTHLAEFDVPKVS